MTRKDASQTKRVTGRNLSRLQVNGKAASSDEAWDPAVTTYAHFTAMQVRDGRTRGLDLHLDRLDEASLELFGAGLDADLIRRYVRSALGGDVLDASVRIYVFHTEAEPSVMVTVRSPADPPGVPQRLESVHYQRPLAHLKHLGGFLLGGVDAQTYFRQRAQRRGFDDALLTGPGGIVSEAAVANIAFVDGAAIVWPDAPALPGITMQLLQRELSGRSIPWRRTTVRRSDLGAFDGAFLSNARGIWPVSQIDGVRFDVDALRMADLGSTYASVQWDDI
jgi:branched-subunit amino acid aminotransferase/4-amino-4-deoxychorismate lyase